MLVLHSPSPMDVNPAVIPKLSIFQSCYYGIGSKMNTEI